MLLHLLPFSQELNSENSMDVGEKGNGMYLIYSITVEGGKKGGGEGGKEGRKEGRKKGRKEE